MIEVVLIVAALVVLAALVVWAVGRVGEHLDRFANDADGEWLS